MGSTYSESRRPSRDTIRSGFVDDDINIPHRGMLQSARRLQETRALLASPGPLESMLKTTTETGDIGVYSSRPSRSSSRARTPFAQAAPRPGRMIARSVSANAPGRRRPRHDRKDIPSHRDTTSEIISLYESHRQRPMPALFSRSLDDVGPRSYSLTSCSSRYMSDQKSTGTWDSRSSGGSGGVLARPRSPYPYHTRLKRPGVRPSSPAVTMDGNVDYSRMIEVNRPSYRTIHRSYGRSYPPNPPRRPRSRNRPYDNHAARSVPGDVDSYVLSRHGSVFAPPHPSWLDHASEEVVCGPSDQSAGVSSITSIVQMYASPAAPPLARQHPVSRTGSFYYDYSEDFPEHALPVHCASVSPVQKGALDSHQSLVPEDGFECITRASASMEATTVIRAALVDHSSPGNPCAERGDRLPQAQRRSFEEDSTQTTPLETPVLPEAITSHDIQSSPDKPGVSSNPADSPTETSEEEIVSDPDVTSTRGSLHGASDASKSASDQQGKHQDGSHDPDVSGSATLATPLAAGRPNTADHAAGQQMDGVSPDTPSAITLSAASRRSQTSSRSSGNPDTPSLAARRRSNVYSLQPGLIDLKSFVRDLDDAGLLHDADVSGNLDGSQCSNLQSGHDVGNDVPATLARTNKVLAIEPVQNSTHRNMRDPAVSSAIRRLKTGAVPERCQSAEDASSVILAPQPVSPARQLRLRSSVSKLMKALPPLPPTSTGTDEPAVKTGSAERRLPELPAPSQFPPSAPRQSLEALFTRDCFTHTNECARVEPNIAGSGNAAVRSTASDHASQYIYGDIWDTHFNGDDVHGCSLAGWNPADTCAPDDKKGAEHKLADHDVSGNGPGRLHPPTQGGKRKSSTVKSKTVVRETPARLNLNTLPRGTSLDSSRVAFQNPLVPATYAVPVGADSSFGNEVRPQRGLKKRLSDFRIRLTESRHRPVNWSSPDVRVEDDGEIIGLGRPVTSSTGSPESGQQTSNSNSATDDASARGLRYKLSRWMKSAKNAVNACKRLSSSSGGTSLDTDF